MLKKREPIIIEIKPKYGYTSSSGGYFLNQVAQEFLRNPLKGHIKTVNGTAKWKSTKV